MLDKGAFDGYGVEDDVQYAVDASKPWKIELVDGSSMNNPFWPGITLDEERFYGSDYSACMVLVHEWMHNLDREGLGHEMGWFDGTTINEQIGPNTDDNDFQKAWDEYLKRKRT